MSALSSLAAALESSDPKVRAATFVRLSDEALALCGSARSEQMRRFWLSLSEDFQAEARRAA